MEIEGVTMREARRPRPKQGADGKRVAFQAQRPPEPEVDRETLALIKEFEETKGSDVDYDLFLEDDFQRYLYAKRNYEDHCNINREYTYGSLDAERYNRLVDGCEKYARLLKVVDALLARGVKCETRDGNYFKKGMCIYGPDKDAINKFRWEKKIGKR